MSLDEQEGVDLTLFDVAHLQLDSPWLAHLRIDNQKGKNESIMLEDFSGPQILVTKLTIVERDSIK